MHRDVGRTWKCAQTTTVFDHVWSFHAEEPSKILCNIMLKEPDNTDDQTEGGGILKPAFHDLVGYSDDQTELESIFNPMPLCFWWLVSYPAGKRNRWCKWSNIRWDVSNYSLLSRLSKFCAVSSYKNQTKCMLDYKAQRRVGHASSKDVPLSNPSYF